ncbi:MAG: hypothetical protein J6E46_13600 [Faecalicoccus sp.]|nr:hypothetical protein [Faecalicoccus sp.]
MIFLYIDDTYFLPGEFSRQMLYKLSVVLSENTIPLVMISTSGHNQRAIERFTKDFEEIRFILGDTRFESEGNEYILDRESLSVNGRVLHPYEGTYYRIDSSTLEIERIYLYFFPNEETDMISLFTQEISDVIDEMTGQSKKKKLKS